MNNGWVKLHRQILTNDIFRHDHTAWRVFMVLLVTVDSKSGSWSGGLYQLSDLTGIKKDALYKALKRLEDAEMINRLVNARYTVYSICKWAEYQGNNDSSVNAQYTLGKHTVNAQYNSNKKENKNKKENNTLDTLDSKAVKVEEALFNSVMANYPNLKIKEPNGRWASDIEKIHRLDGYSWEDIIKTAAWSQRDNFWKQNIQSGSSLRKQFSKLIVKTATTVGGTY